MTQFRCPRCGGFLYEEHDEDQPKPLPGWFVCVECHSIYDFEDIDVSDEAAA